MTKVQFDEWVAKILRGYEKDICFNNCDTRRIKNVIICVDCNNNVGIAKCHPNDKFNERIGIAIAYARMKGFEVPKVTVYKKPSEMRYGNKFLCYGTVYTFVGKDPTDETFFIGVSVSKYGERNFVRLDNRGYEMVD